MKKLSVLVLSLLTVVFMTSAALALDASGEVEVTWGSNDDDGTEFGGTRKVEMTVSLDKEYDDVVSAGVGFKMGWDETEDPPDDIIFELDGSGWIKLDYDVLAVTASTDVNGNAANDLDGEYDMAGAAGLQLDVPLADGCDVLAVVNAGDEYNILVKGTYAVDALSLGAGYQTGQADATKDAMAVWGSFEVMDGVSLGAEYASRSGDQEAYAILAKASYDVAPLTADVTFMNQEAGFVSGGDSGTAGEVFMSEGPEGSLVIADLSFAVMDDLSIGGNVNYAMVEDWADEKKLSYEVNATSTAVADLELKGWYKAYDEDTEVGASATYSFVEDVTGTFELTSADETAYSVTFKAAL